MNRTEHLLVILMEECSEVQKNASKALRFGLDDHAPDSNISNSQMITNEIGDLYAAIQMLFDDYFLYCLIPVLLPSLHI